MSKALPMEPKALAAFHARAMRHLYDAPNGTVSLAELAEALDVDVLAAECLRADLRAWGWVQFNALDADTSVRITSLGLAVVELSMIRMTVTSPWGNP